MASKTWLNASRRQFLKRGGALVGGAWLAGCRGGSGGASEPTSRGARPTVRDAGTPDAGAMGPAVHRPLEPAGIWPRTARIGGCDASVDREELLVALDALAAQGVSVVELDSTLSFYLTETQFENEARALDGAAKEAHARGMRAVIYIPTLEVLTSNVATAPASMFRDHPDWVQMDIEGKPNRFVGGDGRVFWVEPGTESAWLCPSTPYAEYFLQRIERLARTALDGVWGDVPLFSDIAARWPCTCPYCRARFEVETGGRMPAAVDWNDPWFRRWVSWRHKVIWDFEQKILARARKVRPDFQVIIETVTMDYTSSTVQGLDPASGEDGEVLRVWEVDAVSDRTSMRFASADDWLDMAVMMKFGAGVSGSRPSWVFCYGAKPDDAERVFGLALATGNNPFELKVPTMTETVSAPYRTRVFNWLKDEAAVYDGAPMHEVAVVYSPASRDYLDRASGVGLYSSLNRGDNLWWSTNVTDTVAEMQYLADFRGWCRALIHAHMPFDVLPAARLRPEALAGYRLLVVPSAVALSDQAIQQLSRFSAAGGAIIASGPDLGRYDDDGRDRGAPSLVGALGTSGRVVHAADRVGRMYLRKEGQQASAQLAMAIGQRQLTTNAPSATVFGIRRSGDQLALVTANLDGLGASPGAIPTDSVSFDVALALGGRQATAVVVSRPASAKTPVPFEMREGRAHFRLQLETVGVATITLA